MYGRPILFQTTTTRLPRFRTEPRQGTVAYKKRKQQSNRCTLRYHKTGEISSHKTCQIGHENYGLTPCAQHNSYLTQQFKKLATNKWARMRPIRPTDLLSRSITRDSLKQSRTGIRNVAIRPDRESPPPLLSF